MNMTTTPLTPSQHAILAHALGFHDGRLVWFPDGVKGGARKKVLDAMSSRGLIASDGAGWLVAPGGYRAMEGAGGTPEPVSAVPTEAEPSTDSPADPEIEALVTDAEARWMQETRQPAQERVSTPATPSTEVTPRTREHSKQAQVIAMLRRPEGATIDQISQATGWQAHTVRGTMAGALKKKLGLVITSDKVPGAVRVYRID
jgi:hypothetical protein